MKMQSGIGGLAAMLLGAASLAYGAERAAVQAAQTDKDKAAKAAERFWLQAGSFANEAEAEDLKARLALAGWEAAIQPVNLPDKG